MMDHDELVGEFAQTVGVEKAGAVVADAAEAVGLADRSAYTSGEVSDICTVIRDRESGYLRLVASEIQIHVQAQERFGALLENIPDPAVVVSFDGVGPVVDTVNGAFEETFGFDGATACGRRLTDLIVPDGEDEGAADSWAVSGETARREVRRRTADGEVRTFLFRPVVVTRERGDVEGYGIYTDITERKQRERKLEHKNEQLERFASVVSHDLRNPLNVADGHVQLATDLAADDAVVDRLESAAAAHDRMSTLIDELLALARHGETVGETSPVDLESVCREAWDGVDTGDATLIVDPLPTVVADRSRTRELFANLFRNSVEHGAADGESAVTVRVRELPHAEEGPGFAVEDDGRGIPPEERDEVFEQGYSTAESGTGFGLSIVRAIVQAHGWEVAVTESDDGGARFEITGVTRYEE